MQRRLWEPSLLIELVKSTIYRDLGMIHPLQDFVDYVTVIDKEGGDIEYGVDLEGVGKLVGDLDKED